MQEKQEKIYYITADSYAAALHSPHLEVFRKKDVEVLLLTDRVDEWLVSHLNELQGQAPAVGCQGSSSISVSWRRRRARRRSEKIAEEHKDLVERIKTALGDSGQRGAHQQAA